MASYPPIVVPSKLLDENHLAMIQSALAVKDLVNAHLQSAKRVGMDTTQLQKDMDNIFGKLLAFKHEFFPGR